MNSYTHLCTQWNNQSIHHARDFYQVIDHAIEHDHLDPRTLARDIATTLSARHQRPDITNALIAAGNLSQGWTGLAYHNKRHHTEVTSMAMVLSQALPPKYIGLLAIAAILHDIGYDEVTDVTGDARERHSAQIARQVCLAHGMPSTDAQYVYNTIIATYPGYRASMLDAAHDPATEARNILLDSDLILSAGMNPDCTDARTARVSSEIHHNITLPQWQAFCTNDVKAWISLPAQRYFPTPGTR